MKHGSLFSGIGGFDLAAQWMGWENVFSCEINPFGQRVLKYYWPNAIHYEDITKTDFSVHRGRIDILTGGFPCQPFSLAGKRKGTADDRHLWPRMLEVIKQVQPLWIVGENVYGIVNWDGGLVFEQVCADLESEGYEVQPVILPACAVNAPHRRDRTWFVAHSHRNGERLLCGSKSEQRQEAHPFNSNISEHGVIADTESKRFQGHNERRGCSVNRSDEGLQFRTENKQPTSDPNSGRQPRKEYRKEKSEQFAKTSIPGGWQNFPTQPPLCGRNDGISSRLDGITFSKHRNESIKAYGNAVVPVLVYEIFKVISKMERLLKIESF